MIENDIKNSWKKNGHDIRGYYRRNDLEELSKKLVLKLHLRMMLRKKVGLKTQRTPPSPLGKEIGSIRKNRVGIHWRLMIARWMKKGM